MTVLFNNLSWIAMCRKMKLDLCLSLLKYQPQWTKGLNVRPKTGGLLEKKEGGTMKGVGIGKNPVKEANN